MFSGLHNLACYVECPALVPPIPVVHSLVFRCPLRWWFCESPAPDRPDFQALC